MATTKNNIISNSNISSRNIITANAAAAAARFTCSTTRIKVPSVLFGFRDDDFTWNNNNTNINSSSNIANYYSSQQQQQQQQQREQETSTLSKALAILSSQSQIPTSAYRNNQSSFRKLHHNKQHKQ
jgi:hypothetical protein